MFSVFFLCVLNASMYTVPLESGIQFRTNYTCQVFKSVTVCYFKIVKDNYFKLKLYSFRIFDAFNRALCVLES